MPAILLTRPAPASDRFAAMLRARLGEVRIVISPLLRIKWQASDLGQGVPVFTSRHGVDGFLRAGGTAGGLCWCVGDATAAAATEAGFNPRSARGDADALVSQIIESGEPGPFLHVRGAHTRGDVADRLRAAGLHVTESVVYDQVAQGLSTEAAALLKCENPVILPLFSPRTARQFVGVWDGSAPLFVPALSPAVAKALAGLEVRQTVVASRPEAEAMADATERLFDAALQLEGARGAK